MGFRFGIHAHFFLWCFLSISHWFSGFTSGADRIRTGQFIRDGDTLVSASRKFALGFFSPRGSAFRYVGIWFNGIGTRYESVVWVANREAPISGTGGVLTIGDDGILILKNGGNRVVWSRSGPTVSRNSTAVLTNVGNLELRATGNTYAILWQSFEDPTDTYLPGMKVHFTAQDGEKRVFNSWRSAADPSPGNYTMGVDPRGAPQIVLWEGRKRRWRSGHWNGLQFTGVPGIRAMYLYGFRLLPEPDGRLYFMYMLSNTSDVIRFRLIWEGVERQERWIADEQNWTLIQTHPVDECDGYNRCGPFGKCNQIEVPKCSCMHGFVPQDDDQWRMGDWSGGCVRKTTLHCEKDGFQLLQNVKLPDFVDYVGIEDGEACKNLCRQNCSCSAYAFVSGINCMIWSGDLLDVQQFVDGGSSLHIRIARSDLNSGSHLTRIVAVGAVSLGALLGLIVIWLLVSRQRRNTATPKVGPSGDIPTDCNRRLTAEGQQGATGTEFAMFSFNSIAAATDNFSYKNKLGQGGFGLVYKGMLPGDQMIAVKRLSKRSGQGLEEFKNEITLIAKLQHRNLVRLLGCCTEGDERMLLYEYMPNNSLDSYLFDPEKRSQLDWSTRFNIIEGIARGLLYLHRDSRLRIIHRDLKASNILLDEYMNPKISDFGMARIFGGNQNEITSTNRVVGTFGYMAPEYAMEGLFSLKSDVYSFGVLLLEIITGQKNTSFRTTEYGNIIGYAWDWWESGRAMELLDPSIPQPCQEKRQLLRCLHVGMLCVQDLTSHRPDMQSVVVMLESESAAASLPAPQQPTLVSGRHNLEEKDYVWDIGNQDGVSSNNITVTVILGR